MSPEAELLRSALEKLGLRGHIQISDAGTSPAAVLVIPVTSRGQRWMQDNAGMLERGGAKPLETE